MNTIPQKEDLIMIRRFVMTLSLILALSTATAFAQQAKAKEGTIEGELVDTKCYLSMGARGEGHRECAIKCAKMGIPVAIVDKSGKTYTIAHPTGDLADYQGLQARVTGKIFEDSRTIVPAKVEVNKDGKWTEVKLSATMM